MGNKIESVEGLNKIHLSELSWLGIGTYICQYLGKNNINNIADVRKGQWPSFTFISLGKSILTK